MPAEEVWNSGINQCLAGKCGVAVDCAVTLEAPTLATANMGLREKSAVGQRIERLTSPTGLTKYKLVTMVGPAR
jgi:hypothetical protein